jgi:heme oxygenase
LRERTRAQHNATEALMPITAPGLTLPEYTGYLRALYTVLAPWEEYALSHCPAGLDWLVVDRRRALLIEKDLRLLHAVVPPVPSFAADCIPGLGVSGPHGSDAASFLGAMYVVEGSSLGGQYIARHLETTLGLTPDNGAAYFRGYGERTGAFWQQFKSVVAALPDSEEDRLVSAAQGMFALFALALSAAFAQTPRPEMASLS